MKSTPESNPDLQQLWQLWFILKRRWRPATVVFGSIIGLTALITLWQKPEYKAEGQLLLESKNSTASLTESGKEIGESRSLSWGDPLDTQAQVIRSIPTAEKTIAALNLKDDEGEPLDPEDFIEQRLKVNKMRGTDILQVFFKSPDPREAAAVVNHMMNLYIEDSILTDRGKAVTTREFITKQLPETEATVRQAELAMRQFKEENNVVNLEEEEELVVGVVTNLDNQVTKARARLAVANARSEVLRSKLGMNSREAVAASSLSQSRAVQPVLEGLQQAQAQLAVQRTRYQEANPAIADLKDKEATLKTILQGRIEQVIQGQQPAPNGNLQLPGLKQQFTADLVNSETERLGLTREVSTLSNVLATYKRRAKALPKLQQTQRQLERQLEAAQSTYEVLLKKLQEIRVVENQSASNARILVAARIPKNFSLRPIAMNLALGGLLGTLLSVATIFVLEIRDKSIKTAKEAGELFELTLLGIIPLSGKPERITSRARVSGPEVSKAPEQFAPKLVVRDRPRSYISESYRMLQSNLKFLSSDAELKIIVVTSSVAGEGKSTVSANLAVAMAQRGRRVLLVDADVRRPTQHYIWGLSNTAGLSDVLVRETELRTAIKEVLGNLDVLSAGATPPNPGTLLDSKRMASLIESFSHEYDFVILDTPSLSVADDPRILGKMADGILLVARPGVVDSASAAASKELLRQSEQNILGLVVNGVKPENEPYNYYTKEYYAEEEATTPPEKTKAIGNAGSS